MFIMFLNITLPYGYLQSKRANIFQIMSVYVWISNNYYKISLNSLMHLILSIVSYQNSHFHYFDSLFFHVIFGRVLLFLFDHGIRRRHVQIFNVKLKPFFVKLLHFLIRLPISPSAEIYLHLSRISIYPFSTLCCCKLPLFSAPHVGSSTLSVKASSIFFFGPFEIYYSIKHLIWFVPSSSLVRIFIIYLYASNWIVC